MKKLLINLLLLIAVILFFGYKEYALPYWRMRIQDVFTKSAPAFEVTLANNLNVKMYPDTRPYVGKIASVQKGLILSNGSTSLIGEGYGFGLPMVVKDSSSYLASTAQTGKFTRGDTIILSKKYIFDTRENPGDFPTIRYSKVAPIGSIRIDYVVFGDTIDVISDLRGMQNAKYESIYFMNEQAGSHFKYALSGLGKKIDLISWQQPVPMPYMGIRAPELGITFWVRDNQETLKYLGREILQRWHWWGLESTNWAGCDLRYDKKGIVYRYRITIQKNQPD